jgi:signal transduction histidine kinase
MIYYFCTLLAAAVILLISNHRSVTNRWAAFFLGSASIGGLAGFANATGFTDWSRLLQLLNHTLTPYGVVVFSCVYAERPARAITQTWLKLLLLIPPAVMIAITLTSPEMSIDYRLLLVWTAPYYLAACCMLIVPLWKEQNRRRKRNRFITTVIIVPPLLGAVAFINVAKAISPEFDFFRYISVFIFCSFAIALLSAFIYGVLGVRLRFERDPLESAMKAVSTGTAILNHSIKNEIGKIAITTENLKAVIPENEETRQHLQIIANASEHMLAMVTRIHSRMKDIVLKEEACRPDLIVEACLEDVRPLFDNRGVNVTAHYTSRPVLWCDPVHLKEVIGNVLMNALEAIPGEGAVTIRLEQTKSSVRLSVQDSGKGIPDAQLAQVFEPFYSTKNRSLNFGLGLSYVYNVMQRSGGSVDISSKMNAGTVITLIFPHSRKTGADRRGTSGQH